MPSKVTLADVARLASTSHATASRALNARGGVRPEVREAVLRAADELGYRPNRASRQGPGERTSTVGLVFWHHEVLLGSLVFSDLTAGVVSALTAAGYHTVLMFPTPDQRRAGFAEWIRRSRVDGLILFGQGEDFVELLRWLATSGPPSVLFGRSDAMPGFSYIDVDNVQAGQLAIEHLVDGGRRRIGVVTASESSSWSCDRTRGCVAALQAAGVEDGSVILECAHNTEAIRAAARQLLDLRPRLDAILLCSEMWLPGLLAELRSSAVAVPGELAVVTFDDGALQQYSVPSITAVRQPLRLIGQQLVRALIDELEHGTPTRHIRIEAEIVARASSPALTS